MNYLAYVNGTAFGMQFSPLITALFAIALVWSAVWKGIALWKSARNKQIAWFIVLLVVNTVGILEIIYILFFQRKGKEARRKRSRR